MFIRVFGFLLLFASGAFAQSNVTVTSSVVVAPPTTTSSSIVASSTVISRPSSATTTDSEIVSGTRRLPTSTSSPSSSSSNDTTIGGLSTTAFALIITGSIIAFFILLALASWFSRKMSSSKPASNPNHNNGPRKPSVAPLNQGKVPLESPMVQPYTTAEMYNAQPYYYPATTMGANYAPGTYVSYYPEHQVVYTQSPSMQPHQAYYG
jgi:hypothetical protein